MKKEDVKIGMEVELDNILSSAPIYGVVKKRYKDEDNDSFVIEGDFGTIIRRCGTFNPVLKKKEKMFKVLLNEKGKDVFCKYYKQVADSPTLKSMIYTCGCVHMFESSLIAVFGKIWDFNYMTSLEFSDTLTVPDEEMPLVGCVENVTIRYIPNPPAVFDVKQQITVFNHDVKNYEKAKKTFDELASVCETLASHGIEFPKSIVEKMDANSKLINDFERSEKEKDSTIQYTVKVKKIFTGDKMISCNGCHFKGADGVAGNSCRDFCKRFAPNCTIEPFIYTLAE